MATDAKLDRLRSATLFSKVNVRDLEKIAAITTEVDVVAGRVIAEQGRQGHEAYVIESGEAEISVDGEVVAVIGAGQMVGEMGLIDGGPRAATVTAKTDMRVLVIEPGHFQVLLDSPSVTKALLQAITARLRAADALLHHHH